MTGEIENLILEHLRAIRGELGTLREDVATIKMRMMSIEHHIAGSTTTEVAHTGQLDQHEQRLRRIEAQLNLAQ